MPDVAHDPAGQQREAERMVAVRFARRFDLGVRATDALGAEKRHGVVGLHLQQLLFAAAVKQRPMFLNRPRA